MVSSVESLADAVGLVKKSLVGRGRTILREVPCNYTPIYKKYTHSLLITRHNFALEAYYVCFKHDFFRKAGKFFGGGVSQAETLNLEAYQKLMEKMPFYIIYVHPNHIYYVKPSEFSDATHSEGLIRRQYGGEVTCHIRKEDLQQLDADSTTLEDYQKPITFIEKLSHCKKIIQSHIDWY